MGMTFSRMPSAPCSPPLPPRCPRLASRPELSVVAFLAVSCALNFRAILQALHNLHCVVQVLPFLNATLEGHFGMALAAAQRQDTAAAQAHAAVVQAALGIFLHHLRLGALPNKCSLTWQPPYSSICKVGRYRN